MVLAVAAVAAGASVLATTTRLSGATTGLTVPTSRPAFHADGIEVDTLPGVTGPVRSGDVVIAINGRPLDAWARSLLAPAAQRLDVAAGQTVDVAVRRGSETVTAAVTLIGFPVVPVLVSAVGTLGFVSLMLAIAIVVFVVRPAVPASGALLLASVGAAGSTLPFLLSQDPLDLATGAFVLEYPAISLVYALLWAGLIDFWLVFPRPVAALVRRPRLRVIAYVAVLGGSVLADVVALAGASTALAGIGAMAAASLLPVLAAFLIMPVALAVHWRRGPIEDRRLLRGFAFVVAFIAIADAIVWVIPESLGQAPLLPWTILGVTGLPFPILIAAAIVRHRAFDIDVAIRRSLVYGGLSVAVLITYVVATAVLGASISHDSPFATALLATGIAALAALPVRDLLQLAVRRLLYGDRDEPVRAMRRLGERLETSADPRAMLETVVATVADALRLPYVAIELDRAGNARLAATRGAPTRDVTDRPVRFGNRELGRLVVGSRGPAEPLSAADLHLLDDLARQVGIAAHAAILTEDLQASRERIVSAREEERRRLRRDLHDGLGPALAAIALRAEAAEQLLPDRSPDAQRLLAELQADVSGAVADIRRLVDGLRPPALDELGLVGAVRLVGERLESDGGLRVSVEADGSAAELPAAIEVAAYRIATEAMTNAVRHAGASQCRVRFEIDRDLRVLIEDDGSGIGPDRRDGHGLASMAERAAELGGVLAVDPRADGGTRVTARLPLHAAPRTTTS
jgi:signal transduction histidine kinase